MGSLVAGSQYVGTLRRWGGRAEFSRDRLIEKLKTRPLSTPPTWHRPAGQDIDGEIQRTVNYAALGQIFRLGASSAAGSQAQAIVAQQLTVLRDRLAAAAASAAIGATQRAHLAHGHRLIARFFEQPKEFEPPPQPTVPPGQPIGPAACDFDAALEFGW